MKTKEIIIGIWFAVSFALLSVDTENLWILAAVTANFGLSGYAASRTLKEDRETTETKRNNDCSGRN